MRFGRGTLGAPWALASNGNAILNASLDKVLTIDNVLFSDNITFKYNSGYSESGNYSWKTTGGVTPPESGLTGIYLQGVLGGSNIRSTVNGTGTPITTVPKGSKAEIVEFIPGFYKGTTIYIINGLKYSMVLHQVMLN